MAGHEPEALWEESLEGEPVTLNFPSFPPVKGTGPVIHEKTVMQRIRELRAARDTDPVGWQDSDHNDDALELARLEDLEEPGAADTLADQVTALALSWAGGDPERLREAERILGRTPYLGQPQPPREKS